LASHTEVYNKTQSTLASYGKTIYSYGVVTSGSVDSACYSAFGNSDPEVLIMAKDSVIAGLIISYTYGLITGESPKASIQYFFALSNVGDETFRSSVKSAFSLITDTLGKQILVSGLYLILMTLTVFL